MGLRIGDLEESLDLFGKGEEIGHLLIKTEDLKSFQCRFESDRGHQLCVKYLT